MPCRCAGGIVIIVRSYNGPEPFHNREVEGPLEGFFLSSGERGKRKKYFHRSRKGEKEGKGGEAFGKSKKWRRRSLSSR